MTMSNRTQKRALEAYPPHSEQEDFDETWDSNEQYRLPYIEGYEQAEKDNWGRIEKYLSRQDSGDYATAGFILENFEYFKQKIMEDEQ